MSAPAVRTISQNCLASRIRLLNRLVTGIYDSALRPHGLRISQMNVLVAVAARGPIRASQVCRLMKLEKSTLSRDLERLIARGWLRRSPELEVTPAGLKLLAASARPGNEHSVRRGELLTPAVAEGAMVAVENLWAREALINRSALPRGEPRQIFVER